MNDPVPVDVVEAAVQVAGTAFHFKNPLHLLMRRAGVPDSMWHRYEHESKFQITRHVFADLEAKGSGGYAAQRKLVELFGSLRSFPPEVNAEVARRAVQHLRELTKAARLETELEARDREQRVQQNVQKQSDTQYRSGKLQKLKERFQKLITSEDRQNRGFELEKLLEDLFSLFGIEYKHSYKTSTEQIDGAFKFGPFDYLVEAKWTQNETTVGTLDSFRGRVSRRITSTRGLFCSIAGFRSEVVAQFATGATSNVILMTGEDLAYILEERCTLLDALQLKADKAAQDGAVLVRLADYF